MFSKALKQEDHIRELTSEEIILTCAIKEGIVFHLPVQMKLLYFVVETAENSQRLE